MKTTRNKRKSKVTFKTIPGYAPYAISRMGIVLNQETDRMMSVTDFAHPSGRVRLVNRRNGKRQRIPIETLINRTYGKNTYSTIQ